MPTTTEGKRASLPIPIPRRGALDARGSSEPECNQDPSPDADPTSEGADGSDLSDNLVKPIVDRESLWEAFQGYLPTIQTKSTDEGKIYEYDHEAILGWKALLITNGSVFCNWQTLSVVPFVIIMATLTALVTCFAVPDASHFDTKRFSDLNSYFELFIAVILGFYLSSAYQRWWAAVLAFKAFLLSIKNLIFSLNALGLRNDLKTEVQRLSTAACFILHHEIHISQTRNDTYEHRQKCWKKAMHQVRQRGFLTHAEMQQLEKEQEKVESDQSLGVHSMMIWRWIGDVMSDVRKEPNVAPPMYVRLLFLCEDACMKIEDLKTGITVQLPFSKAHLMSALVQVNNIVMALSCGMAIGSAMSEIMERSGGAQIGISTDKLLKIDIEKHARVVTHLYGAVQVCSMQIAHLCFIPLIYQAILVIAHQLCYPYGDEAFHLPSATFIEQMEIEVHVMEESQNAMRRWRAEAEQKERPAAAEAAATPAVAKDRVAPPSATAEDADAVLATAAAAGEKAQQKDVVRGDDAV